MQTDSPRIWTLVTMSISYDGNHFTIGASVLYVCMCVARALTNKQKYIVLYFHQSIHFEINDWVCSKTKKFRKGEKNPSISAFLFFLCSFRWLSYWCFSVWWQSFHDCFVCHIFYLILIKLLNSDPYVSRSFFPII